MCHNLETGHSDTFFREMYIISLQHKYINEKYRYLVDSLDFKMVTIL